MGEKGKNTWLVGGYSRQSRSRKSGCLLTSSETHKTSLRSSLVVTCRKQNLQNSVSPSRLPSCQLPGCRLHFLSPLRSSIFFTTLFLHLIASSSRPPASQALHLWTPLSLYPKSLGETCECVCSCPFLHFHPSPIHPSIYPSSKILPWPAFSNLWPLWGFFLSIFHLSHFPIIRLSALWPSVSISEFLSQPSPTHLYFLNYLSQPIFAFNQPCDTISGRKKEKNIADKVFIKTRITAMSMPTT